MAVMLVVTAAALLLASVAFAALARAETEAPVHPAVGAQQRPSPRVKPLPPADVAAMTPPLPKPKPQRPAAPPAEAAPAPPVAPKAPDVAAPVAPAQPREASTPAPPAVSSQAAMTSDGYAACVDGLKAAGHDFTPLGDFAEAGCTLSGAVRVKAVATAFGVVALSGEPVMLCSFARQVIGWVRDVGAPLAAAYTGRKLTVIETGPGLVCRNRYNQAGQKVSEHARGNALDIASFHFDDGARLAVRPGLGDAEPKPSLMRALRASGCGYFTTVLGPGSNAAHEEHLHFDYAMRDNAWNYRICE